MTALNSYAPGRFPILPAFSCCKRFVTVLENFVDLLNWLVLLYSADCYCRPINDEFRKRQMHSY